MNQLKSSLEELDQGLKLCSLEMSRHELPVLFKVVLSSLVDHMQIKVKDALNTLESSKRAPKTKTTWDSSLPPIEMPIFSLYPESQELVDRNARHRLPKFDFTILYDLSVKPGQDVRFKRSQSLCTHISKLRRDFPFLKGLIVSKGDGVYCLELPKKAE